MQGKNRRFWVIAAAIACFVLFVGSQVAARRASGAFVESSLQALAILGPLGLSPFISLGVLGALTHLGVMAPAGLGLFAHPLVFLGSLMLGVGFLTGRSAKLSKPLVELLGIGESVFVVGVAFVVLLQPFFQAAPPRAGGLAAATGLVLGMALVLAVVVVRTSLDIITWLTPIPTVDAWFQGLKILIAMGFIWAASASSMAAILLNLGLLLLCSFFLGWAVRTLRFGVTAGWDVSQRMLGRLTTRTSLPRDEVMPSDIGPLVAFAQDLEGLKRRSPIELELKAGRWFANESRRSPKKPARPLGDDCQALFLKSWTGTQLCLPGGRVFLPARYNHLIDELAVETKAESQPQKHRSQKAQRAKQRV